MKELLTIDKELRRVHKYKIIKPNCDKLPNYLIRVNDNPEFYVQFEENELKIYSLNSKSINKDLEIIPVKIKRLKSLVIKAHKEQLEKFIEFLKQEMEQSTQTKNFDIFIYNDNPLFLNFKKINKKENEQKIEIKKEIKKDINKKWYQFWK